MKPQPLISLIIGVSAFVAGTVSTFYIARAASDEKISELSERVTKMETILPEVRDDVEETNEDVKDLIESVNDIKRAFNIP